MVDLPDRYGSEVQVRRKSSGWDYWIIAQLVIIFELLYLAQYLQSIASTTIHADALILFIKLMNFG